MISMLWHEGQSCPVFNCDICGDMIGHISEGVALYTHRSNASVNTKIDVLHVHNTTCYALAKQTMNGCDSQPLDAHLYFLCTNTELDVKQFGRLERMHRAAQNSD